VVTFRHVSTFVGAEFMLVTGVTDLDLRWGRDGPVLYATTRPGGGITALRVDGGGMDLLDRTYIAGVATVGQDPGLHLVEREGGVQALVSGVDGRALAAYAVGDLGGITAIAPLRPTALPHGDMTRMIVVETGGRTLIYAAHRDSAGISTYGFGPEQSLFLSGMLVSSAQQGLAGNDVSAFASINHAGRTFLLAATFSDDRIASYEIGATGLPVLRSGRGMAEGLGIADPTALETVTLADRAYVIVASAGSSTLTVLELGQRGGASGHRSCAGRP